MNSNRKAEIQRRLTMTAVPKPPDGLLDPIKGDIPKYLQTMEVEKQRYSRSIAFSMRFAASIIVLFASLFVTMRVLTTGDEPVMKTAATTPAPLQQRAALHESKETAPTAVDELHVEITEVPRETTTAQTAQARTVPPPAPMIARRDAPQTERDDDREEALERGRVNATVGGAAADTRTSTMQMAEAAPAPSFTYSPNPEVMSNTTVVEQQSQSKSRPSARAATQSFVREAVAADLNLAPKDRVFGISVDPNAFERVKTTIERGGVPAAGTVNVEALVNYFAGTPKRVRHDVQLEAEGSPAPVENAGHRGILRFTVDTRTNDLEDNASTPPIATNAHIDVVFNPRAVASFHRVGGDDTRATENTLLANTSVTGLFEIELKNGVSPTTRIATVTLRYKSIADGREKSHFVVVRGSDFARKWMLASRRHRLASLGAVWGESLKSGSAVPVKDVAVKAEALATQAPNDSRARELAAAARVGAEQQQ